MAKTPAKKTPAKRPTKTPVKGTPKAKSATSKSAADGEGSVLVIVESPAKAKTIEKYLGPGFEVIASKGHVRDLPERAKKQVDTEIDEDGGAVVVVVKAKRRKKGDPAVVVRKIDDVPGVNLETFEETYEVTADRKTLVKELRSKAKRAKEVWFATDLDREGEAISWHLAEVLEIDPTKAKRVVFNAITKSAIEEAFAHPHAIDLNKVAAQRARRVLDRIVGYKLSPILWRIGQGARSAGRVQSVAVRLVVDREREIRNHKPTEEWNVVVRLTPKLAEVTANVAGFAALLARRSERVSGPTQVELAQWLREHSAFEAKLIEVGGKNFKVIADADATTNLVPLAESAAQAAGLSNVTVASQVAERGVGRARKVSTITGALDNGVVYAVESVETSERSQRPRSPLITSSLQMAASSELGYASDRTMRIAQQLYEGIDVPGEGRVGLITYMRTDSTHLSGEALSAVRRYIEAKFPKPYLPEKPNFFGSANKQAQEAHEAIRPTDPFRDPKQLRGALPEEQWDLYELIWRRFVACQMTAAKYNQTSVRLVRSDKATGAVLQASGRVETFDGWTRLVKDDGADTEESRLPNLEKGTKTGAFSLACTQRFSPPPSRFTEASLVKELESDGIGRPSTYASIMKTIAQRGYVNVRGRTLSATMLGEFTTDLLMRILTNVIEVKYTGMMEKELDRIEDGELDRVTMLKSFFAEFASELDAGSSKPQPEWPKATFACPKCGRQMRKVFGGGRYFLSCPGYHDKLNHCDAAVRLDDEWKPVAPEEVDIICPLDGKRMVLRSGRFGQFIAAVTYPDVKFLLNIDKKGCIRFPSAAPLLTDVECSKCKKPCNLRTGKRGPWLGCSGFPKCRGRGDLKKLDEAHSKRLIDALNVHDAAQPKISLTRKEGSPVPEGTPIVDLMIPGAALVLVEHPDALVSGAA